MRRPARVVAALSNRCQSADRLAENRRQEDTSVDWADVGKSGSERALPPLPTRRKSAILPPVVRLTSPENCRGAGSNRGTETVSNCLASQSFVRHLHRRVDATARRRRRRAGHGLPAADGSLRPARPLQRGLIQNLPMRRILGLTDARYFKSHLPHRFWCIGDRVR